MHVALLGKLKRISSLTRARKLVVYTNRRQHEYIMVVLDLSKFILTTYI
uniref:Uncharacterized protein n=1 Tax=Arundo donax TaxID=35708 RepID=A0A0A8YIW8_ARUDO